MKRLLEDPYHLDGQMPAWEMPPDHVIPVEGVLRHVHGELQRTLKAPPSSHIAYWLGVMGKTLAIKRGDKNSSSLNTEGWIIACGDLPADLWAKGCTEILKTAKWFPAPSDLLAEVGADWAERKRMRDRTMKLIDRKLGLDAPRKSGFDRSRATEKPFVVEPKDVRLRTSREAFLKIGDVFRAAIYERQLAAFENRDPETWATDPNLAPKFRKTDDVIGASDLQPKHASLDARIEFWKRQHGSHEMVASLVALKKRLETVEPGRDKYEPEVLP